MAIDLRAFIEDDNAIKEGGFAGAIFLTYTLNLTFFEQIIAPALDRAGCANVLVIADPDGYAEAIDMGHRSVTGCGLRYVCAPLPKISRGVQHAKMLFMAGTKRGRLLIGSGNLTYHGYGRNLELYSAFEFDLEKPNSAALYAFQKAWNLIQRIKSTEGLPQVAIERINIIQEKALWLSPPIEENEDFQVWDNFSVPIWQQLRAWRQAMGFSAEPIRSLMMISPYFDKDVHTVKQITTELYPEQVKVVVDPASTNLNGPVIRRGLADFNLQLTGISNRAEPDQETRKRDLHAKALIGVEANGSWCISGSANITHPALLASWQTSGNLELVTFQWSEDKRAFDYLLEDPAIHVWPIQAETLEGTLEGPSDQPKQTLSNFFLEFISLQSGELKGKVNGLPDDAPVSGLLRFLRKEICLPVDLQSDGSFHLTLSEKLAEAEAIQLEVLGATTPYRWLDQPEMLARYGQRSYQERIQRKIETFDGAGKLFEELLNFLWERTDPEKIQEQQSISSTGHRSSRPRDDSNNQDIPDAPPPASFIRPEVLLDRINRQIQRQNPFDRSTWSLRDLLSLILLRLTTETQSSESADSSGNDPEQEGSEKKLDDREKEAITRKRLRDYVIQYCRKYGHRLVEPDFIATINPQLLFENHFTLGRVLLELANKGENFPEFTNKDFQECTWWLWAPLAWPSIIGLAGQSSLSLLQRRFQVEGIRNQWESCHLSSLVVLMLNRSFGFPPRWKEGIRNKNLAALHLAIKELYTRLERPLSNKGIEVTEDGINESLGIKSFRELTENQVASKKIDQERIAKYLETARSYLSPIEERLLPILKLAADKDSNPQLLADLTHVLNENDLVGEWNAFRQNPKKICAITTDEDDEGEVYCVCGGSLTKNAINQIKRGKMVLCTQSRDTWLYQKIQMPFKVV